MASFGSDRGREAAAEAMVYAWQNWEQVRRLSSEWPLHAVDDRPCDVDLLRALESLTPRQRQCVVLVVGCQWTYQDTAESLGLSRSSVQRHVERGTSRLRDLLEEDPS